MDITSYLMGKKSSGGGGGSTNIDLTTGVKFGYSKFTSLPTQVQNANWSDIDDFSNMFYYCESLTTIPLIDTSNATTMSNMFASCYELVNLPVLNTSKVTDMSNMLSPCEKLSNTSLNNVLQMCINATSTYIGEKKLSALGLQPDQVETCKTLSNWTAFKNAGWTDGYSVTINVDLEEIKRSESYTVPEKNCLDGYVYATGVAITLNDPNTSETITGLSSWGYFDTDSYDPTTTKHLTFSISFSEDGEGNNIYIFSFINYHED